MLKFKRKPQQAFVIGYGGEIVVRVLEILKNRVAIGFVAPPQIPIVRREIEIQQRPPLQHSSNGMLILTRKLDESVLIGPRGEYEIVVTKIRPAWIHLGILAPTSVPIHRGEIFQRLERSVVSNHSLLEAS